MTEPTRLGCDEDGLYGPTTGAQHAAARGLPVGFDPPYEVAERAMRAIDGAKLVLTRPEVWAVFVWHGSHTVNVYGVPNWNSVDCFTVGDFEQQTASEDDVRRGAEAWLAELWAPRS